MAKTSELSRRGSESNTAQALCTTPIYTIPMQAPLSYDCGCNSGVDICSVLAKWATFAGRKLSGRNPPTPAEGGGAREGLQVREPCASSSQHEPAGNRRFHCSMLLEHTHHWNRNLLRSFVSARTRGSEPRCARKIVLALFYIRIQKQRWAPKVRPGEARDQVFVAGPGTIFVPYKDPEAAFGTEKCDQGGSLWTRIRLGKAVAGSGVRGSRR